VRGDPSALRSSSPQMHRRTSACPNMKVNALNFMLMLVKVNALVKVDTLVHAASTNPEH